jgi:selenocysteine lyase/cysteine desulfurase/short-subunit dehydrogenase
MNELRRLLPSLHKIHYLNYGATAPLLSVSAERMRQLVTQAEEPLQFHRDEWLRVLESARRSVASLIGASPDEIAFVSSTSAGLSLIANAVRWKSGDEVFYPADEFPSNRYVWENLASKGVIAKKVMPIPDVSFAEQLQSLDLSRARLVAFSAVSYLDGRRHDVAEITKFCHSRGILVAVDAIQAVGAIPISVREWDCDFLSAGGQKWLFGPVGTGFVYIKKRLIDELFNPEVGWASSRDPRDFTAPSLVFTDGARRFEPALSDIPAIGALETSIETMKGIGWEKIYKRIESLQVAAREQLLSLGYTPITPPRAAGILAYPLEGAKEIQKKLLEQKIITSERGSLLRLSMHASVLDEDLAAFFSFLGSKKPVQVVEPPPAERPASSKRAVVTGATRGLGRAIAEELAGRGYQVTLVGRQKEKLEEVRQVIGNQVDTLVFDLSDPEVPLSIDCDLLVNCAVDASAELFSDADLSAAKKSFEVNYWAPLRLAQAALPSMMKRGSGAILNILTSGSRCALPLFSLYSASKGALWAWSESLQRELQGTGVSVINYIPPHMDSETATFLGRKAIAYFSLAKAEKKVEAEVVAKDAIDALERGALFRAPLKVRLKVAWNALFPSRIGKAIARKWMGSQALKKTGL